jgi:transcriptional regulator with XRE-family HTH domain
MPMTLNEVAAANIRSARRARGWSQKQLADEMQKAGIDWTRAVVGYAENGVRSITVDELGVLSIVFGTIPGYWLAPGAEAFDGEPPVVEVGKSKLPGAWLVGASCAGDAAPSPIGHTGPSPWARFFSVLSRVVQREGISGRNARLLHQTLSRLRGVSEPAKE